MPEGRRGLTATRAALAAIVAGTAVLGALPLNGTADAPAPQARVQAGVQDLLQTVDDTARRALAPVDATLEEARRKAEEAKAAANAAPAPAAAPAQRVAAPAQDPATEPPLHGTNPHGQGTVGVVDLQPSAERPAGDDPAGSNTDEEVIVGRAKGEQKADGTYHGHVTIAALFGNEVVGRDTDPGETEAGPLDAIQTNILDAICSGSGNNLCVSAVRADSATTSSGSSNKFSAANAALGGPDGIGVGAAESSGEASSDGTCQTTRGQSSVANVNAGGGAVAGVANSRTESKACKGQAPQQSNSSRVLELGGTGVPIPAAGCADGTPDTVTGIPTLAPIVCNADETNTGQAPPPSGVREALSVFALATGTTSVLKTTTAASESRAQAPPTQCVDGIDNDGDGVADSADGGCHTDGNPNNPGSFDPNDDDESGGNPPGGGSAGERGAACSDGRDNDGDGLIDIRDPGCHTDGNPNNRASFDPDDTSEGGRPAQCADGRDNDGDGRIDAADPGCHTDGDASNPDSYNPRDDSERDGGAAQCSDRRDNDGDGRIDARDPGCHTDGDASNPDSYNPDDDSEADGVAQGALPFTGSNVLGLALAGLLLLAAGLRLRRPIGAR